MTDAQTPERIEIGGGYWWKLVKDEDDMPCYEIAGPDGMWLNANGCSLVEARAFAADLSPPAPAEIEGLVIAHKALTFYADRSNWIDTPSWDGDPGCVSEKAIPTLPEEGRPCDCGDTARSALDAIARLSGRPAAAVCAGCNGTGRVDTDTGGNFYQGDCRFCSGGRGAASAPAAEATVTDAIMEAGALLDKEAKWAACKLMGWPQGNWSYLSCHCDNGTAHPDVLARWEVAKKAALRASRPVQGEAGPSRRLYLDLDGVMADFDAHFPATFGLDHRSLADDAMWTTINAHPSYFRDMPPCAGAVEFFRAVEHLQPIILTACPRTNYEHAARQKRDWVREHLSRRVTVLPVMGGHNKPLFMHAAGDVLIDDWRKNTEAWTAAGGVAILHLDFATTSAALRAALATTPDREAR